MQRVLLTDRQCHIFVREMREFGYPGTTFEQVRQIANDLHAGKDPGQNVLAVIMAQQIDEAMHDAKHKRR